MELSEGQGLRPRTLGEMLDLTFRIYRRGFSLFAPLGVLVTLLGLVVSLVWQAGVFFMVGSTRPELTFDATFLLFLLSFPLLVGATLVIYALGSMAITAATEDLFLGRPARLGASLSKGLRRTLMAAGTSVVCSLLTVIGMLLCCVPGIAALVIWILAVPLVYLEKRSIAGAMSRSWELVLRRGPTGLSIEANWVRIVVVGLVACVVYYLMTLLAQMPILVASVFSLLKSEQPTTTVFGPQLAPLAVLLPLQLLGAAIQGLFLPIMIIPWPLIYFDIRTRHEGLDLEYAASRLGSGGGSGAPPAPGP